MEYANSRYTNTLKEPIYGGNSDDLESLSTKLTENIEAIIDAVQSLEEYEMRLGGQDDTRKMRTRMKDQIAQTNNLIKKTLEILRQFEELKPKKKDELDYRNKILKRTKENFMKQNEKYTKVLKGIQTKEKVYLEARKSITSEKQLNLSMAQTDAESDLQAETMDLEYTEALIRERESDVQDVRRLAHEINLTAQLQARRIQESSEDIAIIADNTEKTEALTEEGKKNIDEALQNQKKMTKRNLICLFVVLVACALIITLVVSNIV